MDETMKNPITEEQPDTDTKSLSNDELKDAISTQMRKIQRQSMLLGAQTACSVIFEKILKTESVPGKRTMNDYKRLIKDVRNFCEVGMSRIINEHGELEPAKTDNTKLMEEPNEGNINESNGETDSSN